MLLDSELKSLGRWALGPLAAGFPMWLESLPNINKSVLLFTSRDARFLYRATQQHSPNLSNAFYLPVSRGFLRRLTIDFEQTQIAISRSPFWGTVHDFLSGRLALTAQEATSLCAEIDANPHQVLLLPDDEHLAFSLCQSVANALAKRIHSDRDVVKQYLLNITALHTNICVVDVGFAGSIQLMLELIHGEPIAGAYVATSRPQQIPQGSRHAWLQNDLDWVNSTILTGSLIIETLLQSDESPLIKWTQAGSTPIFDFGPPAPAQRDNRDLALVQSSGLERARELYELKVSRDLFRQQAWSTLSALTKNPRLVPAYLRHKYKIDDLASGSLHPRPSWEQS